MTSINPLNIFSSQTPGSKSNTGKLTDDELEKLKKLQQSLLTPTSITGQPEVQKTAADAKTKDKVAATGDIERERNSVEGRVATPQTQVAAQSLGGGDIDPDLSQAAGKSAEDEFLDYANGTWEEKMTDMILKSMGLTKEDLQNMSPEEREKVLAKIREMIKEEVEKKTGMNTDSTATMAAASADSLMA